MKNFLLYGAVVLIVWLSVAISEVVEGEPNFTINKIHYSDGPLITSTTHCRKSLNKRLHQNQTQIVSESCDKAEALSIATRFKENYHDDSACPNENWLVAMANADPLSDKIMINIGVNKGYNLAVWMDAFLPFLNITPKVWHNALLVDRPNLWVGCGVCGDCNQTAYHPIEEYSNLHEKSKKSRLDVIIADLNCDNLNTIKDALKAIDTQFNSKMKDYLSVYSTCAALSDKLGTLTKPKCLGFDERCSLTFSNPKSTEVTTVPILTLDKLIENFFSKTFLPVNNNNNNNNKSNHHEDVKNHCETTSSKSYLDYYHTISSTKSYHPIIDMMIIDTEGNDKLVLDGAQQLLRSRSVRSFVFEYHLMSPWPSFKLQDVKNVLNNYGYDCFFAGQQRLWKITGENCWNENYEFYDWSNVFCVLREDIWSLAIQPFIVTTPPPLLPRKNINTSQKQKKKIKFQQQHFAPQPPISPVSPVSPVTPVSSPKISWRSETIKQRTERFSERMKEKNKRMKKRRKEGMGNQGGEDASN